MLLVIEVQPAHYKWRLGNIGWAINHRCRPASAGPSKMGYFQDSWSHVQWKNLLKGLSSSTSFSSPTERLAEILSYRVGLVRGSSRRAKRASGDVMLAWERLKPLIAHSSNA